MHTKGEGLKNNEKLNIFSIKDGATNKQMLNI